jgi:DNA-binding NarL/FixJ family response regulator
MTQILIADDHDVVRKGVRTLIAAHDGWQVCAEASTGREAVAKATQLRPDVAILDVGMPELNGLEATRQIHALVPTTRLLILTVHEINHLAHDFIDAGARGYILKSDAGRVLVEAVETLLKGGTYFTESVQAMINEWATRTARRAAAMHAQLTKREREVLQLVAEGKSNKEIGNALQITMKTAETHRARVMAKLSLHSVADLVRYAIRNQIIEA